MDGKSLTLSKTAPLFLDPSIAFRRILQAAPRAFRQQSRFPTLSEFQLNTGVGGPEFSGNPWQRFAFLHQVSRMGALR